MSRRRGTHGGSVRQRAGRWYISFREPRVSADGALTYLNLWHDEAGGHC